jgi:hypothetical protein
MNPITTNQRFADALAISAGASNPSGIARTLVHALDEIQANTEDKWSDPAVQLIVSQLAYLCGIWDRVSAWARSDFFTASQACRLQTMPEKIIDACRILRQRFGEQAEQLLHIKVPLEESVAKFAAELNDPHIDAHELVAEYLAENAEFKAT